MQGYKEYQNSAVEWLSDLPARWSKRKIKFLGKVKSSSVDKKDEYEIKTSVVHYNDVIKNPIINNRVNLGYTSCSKSQFLSFKLQPGDLLITKDSMDVRNIANVSAIEEIKEDTVCGYHLYVFSRNPKTAYYKYYYYCLNNKKLRKYFLASSVGTTIIGLSNTVLSNTFVPFPPFSEQKIISEFLDRKTSQIDNLIAKKERMIELLKEERAAIINQAVTKGLNPNAEMKDSGIKWLGQIPKHWEIKKLKYLLSDNKGIKIGPFGSSLKAEFITNTGYKVYGQENVITDDFGIGYRYIDENKFAELFNYELFPGDVIITMMGTTGKSKVVPAGISRGVMDSHLLRMRFNCKAAPQYVSFLINDSFYIYTQLKILSKGSIMEGLNSTIVCSLLIALPPKDEQKIILQYLNNKLSEINLILYKEKKGIELLKEYRNTLIPEAVTGKIDVRKNA